MLQLFFALIPIILIYVTSPLEASISSLHVGLQNTLAEAFKPILPSHWFPAISAYEANSDEPAALTVQIVSNTFTTFVESLGSGIPACGYDFWHLPTCIASYDGYIYSETGEFLDPMAYKSSATLPSSQHFTEWSLFTATLMSTLSLYVFAVASTLFVVSLMLSLVVPPEVFSTLMDRLIEGCCVYAIHGWRATSVVFYKDVFSALGLYGALFKDVNTSDSDLRVDEGLFLDKVTDRCAFAVYIFHRFN